MNLIKNDRRAFTRLAFAYVFGVNPGLSQGQSGPALVRFRVANKKHYVLDLRASDIELLEDGVVQKLILFEGPKTGTGGRRTIPIELILLMDVSGSVIYQDLLDAASPRKQGGLALLIKEMLLDVLGSNISISVYVFGESVKRLCAPTNDVVKLKQAFDLVYSTKLGGSRIHESIAETARLASTNSGASLTRLMLVLSDGIDTAAPHPRDVAKIANAYGIPIYPVVLGHDKVIKQLKAENHIARLGSSLPRGVAGATDKELWIRAFASLGELTGGRSFDAPVATIDILRSILESMASQIMCEYVAGYNPGQPGAAPQSHKITVRLRNKNLGKLVGGTRSVTH